MCERNANMHRCLSVLLDYIQLHVCACASYVFVLVVGDTQVWIVGAHLKDGAISAGASSFFVVDFYDFESQATPLLTGLNPRFDFATTYKITIDDLFFRYACLMYHRLAFRKHMILKQEALEPIQCKTFSPRLRSLTEYSVFSAVHQISLPQRAHIISHR